MCLQGNSPGKDLFMVNHYLVVAIAGISTVAVVAAAYVVIDRRRKKESSGIPNRPEKETAEERFAKEWTAAFTESAPTFNGLYQGLQRIVDGKAKKPEKVLREWCARTRYKWEQQPPSELCEELIVPVLDSGNREAFVKWSRLLLEAAAAAGIARGAQGKLTLDENNVNDYTDWDGETLYVEDKVEIMYPAWYQNGVLLEQGSCRKEEEDAC